MWGIYYGWVVVAAYALIMATVFGAYFTFGVFFKPLSVELNLSRTLASIAPSLAVSSQLISAMLWGTLADRVGARIVMVICGAVTGLGWYLGGTANSVWQLYLYFGFLVGIGMGGPPTALAGLTSRWFDKKLGLAVGIGMAGVGGGVFLFPPVARWVIDSYGWREGFHLFAFIAWISIIGSAILLREPSRRTRFDLYQLEKPHTASRDSSVRGDSLDGTYEPDVPEALRITPWQAMRTHYFWVLSIMFFIGNLVILLTLVHLAPRITDAEFSATTAGFMVSAVGLCSIVGKLLGGLAGDRIGPHKTYAMAMFVSAITLFWLIIATSAWMFFLFAVIFGLSYGGWGPQYISLLARRFGARHMGGLFGALFLTGGVGAIVGPTLAGVIFDTTNSYAIAFGLTGFLALIAAALALTLGMANVQTGHSH